MPYLKRNLNQHQSTHLDVHVDDETRFKTDINKDDARGCAQGYLATGVSFRCVDVARVTIRKKS